MFLVSLDEQTNSIQVKTNDETNPTIVAEGNFAYDGPDFTLLILFKKITIAPDNHQQLSELLSTVVKTTGTKFASLILVRLPKAFDNQIDLDKLEFKNKCSILMSVANDDLKYHPDTDLKDQQGEYELITDRQLISTYVDKLFPMMVKDGFWCENWKLEDMKGRINSGTHTVMILDKIKNVPCGFGRSFTLTTADEIFGYFSHILVDRSYQSKGLGRIIVNTLVGMSVNKDDKNQQQTDVTLCLQCADRGSGAISAPKLYRRSGFQHFTDIGSRIAIFSDDVYYHKDHSPNSN